MFMGFLCCVRGVFSRGKLISLEIGRRLARSRVCDLSVVKVKLDLYNVIKNCRLLLVKPDI